LHYRKFLHPLPLQSFLDGGCDASFILIFGRVREGMNSQIRILDNEFLRAIPSVLRYRHLKGRLCNIAQGQDRYSMLRLDPEHLGVPCSFPPRIQNRNIQIFFFVLSILTSYEMLPYSCNRFWMAMAALSPYEVMPIQKKLLKNPTSLLGNGVLISPRRNPPSEQGYWRAYF